MIKNGKLDYKIVLIVCSVAIALSMIVAYLSFNYKEANKVISVEGNIKYVGSDYAILASSNGGEYKIGNDDYEVGDKVLVEIKNVNYKKDPIESKVVKSSVISKQVEFTVEEVDDNKNQEVNQNNNNDVAVKKDNSSVSSTNDSGSEDDVVSYFSNLNNSTNDSQSAKDTLKTGFVNVVDFLFYGGSIKGKTFNELSTSAKLKVLKLALSIDKKVDSYFPDYKQTLSDKYQNVKSRVVEKYLDITTSVCNNNEATCEEARNGFSEMKQSFSLTWSFIKDISGVGVSKLKSWYEVWKNT